MPPVEDCNKQDYAVLFVIGVAVDITEHGKYTKLFSISPEEPWRILRTRLRAEKKYRGSTEGPGGKPDPDSDD